MYEKCCKSCGTTLSSFYKTGYLGCPDCYREFESEITATLNNIQGGEFHVGKKPLLTNLDKELLSDYKMYIKEKEQACLEGRFTDMAKLNNLISELGEELKRRGLI